MAKYQDALPLYRQEKILRRIGVDIPRATLANWMIKLGGLLQPLINLLQDRLLAYDIMGMDETTLQVLKEPGRKARPVLDDLYDWLDKSLPEVPPQTVMGKALVYLHNQWEKLSRYLDDGRLSIDNNATEQAIKPFVIGRTGSLPIPSRGLKPLPVSTA